MKTVRTVAFSYADRQVFDAVLPFFGAFTRSDLVAAIGKEPSDQSVTFDNARRRINGLASNVEPVSRDLVEKSIVILQALREVIERESKPEHWANAGHDAGGHPLGNAMVTARVNQLPMVNDALTLLERAMAYADPSPKEYDEDS